MRTLLEGPWAQMTCFSQGWQRMETGLLPPQAGQGAARLASVGIGGIRARPPA
jgi:hypothetical protein